jgi:cytochrome c peroxidase
MTLQRTFQIVVIGLVLIACEQEEINSGNEIIAEYLTLPNPPPRYTNRNFSDAQIQLGRVLFYDRSLSRNNSVSCGSCHKQEYAFADNVAFSEGFTGESTLRNTLPLVDTRQNNLFWDGRKFTMLEAVMEPIFNHIEMGMDLNQLASKLRELPYYPPLFSSAFGKPAIKQDGIAFALSAFVSVMHSSSSRFDQSTVNRVTLTATEQRGAALFTDKYECAACHQGHLGVQASNEYRFFGFANIGLDESYQDDGRALLTHSPADRGLFRVPSLNNVALTAPYMHDGSFTTLEQVIDHYSFGIASHPNLDDRLKGPDGKPLRFDITTEEKEALIAFLETFTDEDVATDPLLADPFKAKGN